MTEYFSRLFAKNFNSDTAAMGNQSVAEVNEPESSSLITPARPRIGLALSSGAAKGLAHIGVIQVLEENGIDVDVVAGSSMGAYIGSLWAAGHRGDDLEDIAATIRTKMDALRLLDPVFPPRRGFIRGERIRKRLADALDGKQFEDLDKDLYVVATNLEDLSAEVFNQGSVVDAVHASIAIPGICEPVTIDGESYIDGCVANPMPVDLLKRLGKVDKIISVCVLPTADELRYKRSKVRNGKPTGLGGWLNSKVNYWADGNLYNIQRRADFGQQMRLAELSMRNADVRIRPIVCDARSHDYSEYGKYIEVGRKATEAKLDEINSMLEIFPKDLNDREGQRTLAKPQTV